MFDPGSWNWPQWVAMVLLFVNFAGTASLHGRDKPEEKYNGFIALSRISLWMFLLVFGGFFS